VAEAGEPQATLAQKMAVTELEEKCVYGPGEIERIWVKWSGDVQTRCSDIYG
jgi:hypothetical protein